MPDKNVVALRKLSQQYAYSSLQMHEAIARQAGFTGTDHKYLGFFLQRGNLTAGELAGLTGLTTGAVTGLIDRFERKKLVKRAYDNTDRRKIIVVPDTQRITALFEPFYKDFQAATDKLIAGFSNPEIEIIKSYLEKGIALMKQKNDQLNNK